MSPMTLVNMSIVATVAVLLTTNVAAVRNLTGAGA